MLSILAVNKAFKVSRKFAFFRLVSPDAFPPFEPNFLASSSLRLSKGIKFSCPLLPCPHLTIYKKEPGAWVIHTSGSMALVGLIITWFDDTLQRILFKPNTGSHTSRQYSIINVLGLVLKNI